MAVFFWASWSQPCKHLDLVFEQLAKDYISVRFLRVGAVTDTFLLLLARVLHRHRPGQIERYRFAQVEAEEVSDVTDRYQVEAVPHFILLKVPHSRAHPEPSLSQPSFL